MCTMRFLSYFIIGSLKELEKNMKYSYQRYDKGKYIKTVNNYKTVLPTNMSLCCLDLIVPPHGSLSNMHASYDLKNLQFGFAQ